MNRVAQLLALGAAGAGLAVTVALHGPAPDVVRTAEPELVPISTDQQVLGAAAAYDTLIPVVRGPSGQLMMELPAQVDPLALEQDNPAPAGYPPGSAAVLALAAGLLLGAGGADAAGRHAPVDRMTVAAAGLLGAASAVGLLAGDAPAPALWVATALLAALGAGVVVSDRLRPSAGSPPCPRPAPC